MRLSSSKTVHLPDSVIHDTSPVSYHPSSSLDLLLLGCYPNPRRLPFLRHRIEYSIQNVWAMYTQTQWISATELQTTQDTTTFISLHVTLLQKLSRLHRPDIIYTTYKNRSLKSIYSLHHSKEQLPQLYWRTDWSQVSQKIRLRFYWSLDRFKELSTPKILEETPHWTRRLISHQNPWPIYKKESRNQELKHSFNKDLHWNQNIKL